MSRRAQPYRRGPRQPGPVLDAMLRGATLHGVNPADLDRLTRAKFSARRRAARMPMTALQRQLSAQLRTVRSR